MFKSLVLRNIIVSAQVPYSSVTFLVIKVKHFHFLQTSEVNFKKKKKIHTVGIMVGVHVVVTYDVMQIIMSRLLPSTISI